MKVMRKSTKITAWIACIRNDIKREPLGEEAKMLFG
jgi:hypothetical protein